MAKRIEKRKNATDRILELTNKIKNKKIRTIVEEVIDVEISYRSNSRKNFPMQQLRDIIEGHVKKPG